MLWRDAVQPARGEWYFGVVLQEAEERAPPAGAIWEGFSVMWDTDSSEQPQQPLALHMLWITPCESLKMHARMLQEHAYALTQGE